MGIRGLLKIYERVFAVSVPTIREPISPGPDVTAIASIFVRGVLIRAFLRVGIMYWSCFLAAFSGMMPPDFMWAFAEEVVLAVMRVVLVVIATDVSSQLVSIARMVWKEGLVISLVVE